MGPLDALGFGRARRTDPVTSHAAAGEAESFISGHHERILKCLRDAGPLGKDGIASRTDITGVAVARRLPEMERLGMVYLTGNKRASNTGRLEREWAAVKTTTESQT